jgi:hypothetical protein
MITHVLHVFEVISVLAVLAFIFLHLVMTLYRALFPR